MAGQWVRPRGAACLVVLLIGFGSTPRLFAQGLGGVGTVQGTVRDPTGGVMQAVQVRISNPVTGFTRTTTTDASGRYIFSNLPPNPYHVSVEAQGFRTLERDVDVRSGVPITLDLTLALASATAAVDVVGHAEDLSNAIRPRTPTSIRASSTSCRSRRRPAA